MDAFLGAMGNGYENDLNDVRPHHADHLSDQRRAEKRKMVIRHPLALERKDQLTWRNDLFYGKSNIEHAITAMPMTMYSDHRAVLPRELQEEAWPTAHVAAQQELMIGAITPLASAMAQTGN